MPLTLDEPVSSSENVTRAARRLRTTMAAVRVSFTWMGVRKSLNAQQKSQAAESFGAETDFLSAAKKLLDTGHPAFKAVTAVRSTIANVWKSQTLPYPEPGVRLIRQDDVAGYDRKMQDLRLDLNNAVLELDRQYSQMRTAAAQRLGTLFDVGDYPPSLINEFAVRWDFPSVEPPDYLRQLSPELYRQEAARVAARFDEAVQLAETAFIEELSKLVAHLTERLTGEDDGKPKVFRDSAVENLTDFFDRFRRLNVRSNDQLDELVGQARTIIRGVVPQSLRDDTSLRQKVAGELAGVGSLLDGLLVDRPRRNILRRVK